MFEREVADPAFQAVHSRLFGLAYRMLGSRAEAEDVVQDVYVRWHQTDRSVIENPEAWLVAAATRRSIDRLRRLKTEREAYHGPWLPEPLMSDEPSRPDRNLEVSSDLSIAFLVLLERLAPEERAAFLLHDVFDADYHQIATVLGKSEAACRQIVHRARERVRRDEKRFAATDSARVSLLRRFTAAVEARDEHAVLELLAPEVTWTADGGGRVHAAPGRSQWRGGPLFPSRWQAPLADDHRHRRHTDLRRLGRGQPGQAARRWPWAPVRTQANQPSGLTASASSVARDGLGT